MLNEVKLIGTTGKDPEVRTITNGVVVDVSLATSEVHTKDGNKVEKTTWHSVTMFGKLAEFAQKHIKKGAVLYISGKIEYQTWERDGQRHYKTVIIANSVKMLKWPKDSVKASTEVVVEPVSQTFEEEDLPF